MSYVAIVQDLPRDLQFPMLRLVEAVQQDMRAELAVRRSDFERLESAVLELAQAQKRTEQRVDRLETAVLELAQAQKRTEERVEELAQAQKRTEVEIQKLTATQQMMLIDLGQLVGERLERQYRDRAPAYFGRILRRARALSLQDLEAALEPYLTDDEMEDALLLDAVVSGRVVGRSDSPQVMLALEVSSVVDRGDIERAVRRAALLRKAGMLAVPTVAGAKVTQGASEAAQSAGVLLVQDGRRAFWEDALAGVLTTNG
ncbi:MAG: hypothetical protein WA040_10940 [Anaerolineae bacterium]